MAGGFPPLVAALPAVSYPSSRRRCRAGYVSWAKTGPFLFPQKKENGPSYLIWVKAGPFFCILIRKEMGLDSFLQSIVVESAFFIFIFFENIFYRNIFSISQFTVLYPYRPAGERQGPAAQQQGGRDLYVNLKKIYLRGSPWREPAARQGGGRLPHTV